MKKPALRAEARREQRRSAYLSRELATVRGGPRPGIDARRAAPSAPIRRDELLAFAKRWEVRRLEQVANELGVADAEAGAPAPQRPAEPARHRRRARAARGTAGTATARCASRTGCSASATIAPPRGRRCRRRCARAHAGRPVRGCGAGAGDRTPGTRVRSLDELAARVHAVRARAARASPCCRSPTAPRRGARHCIGVALAARSGTTATCRSRASRPERRAPTSCATGSGRSSTDPNVEKIGARLEARRCTKLAAGGSASRAPRSTCGWARSCATRSATTRSWRSRATCWASGSRPLEPPAACGGARAGASALLPWPRPPRARDGSRPRCQPLAEALPRAARGARAVEALHAARAPADRRAAARWSAPASRWIRRVLRDDVRATWARDRVARDRARTRSRASRVNLRSGPQLGQHPVREARAARRGARRRPAGPPTPRCWRDWRRARVPAPAARVARAHQAQVHVRGRAARGDGRATAACTPRFDQAGAATGRLASLDPNLQNIPIRTPQGRRDPARVRGRTRAACWSARTTRRSSCACMAHLSGDPSAARSVSWRRGHPRGHRAPHLQGAPATCRPSCARGPRSSTSACSTAWAPAASRQQMGLELEGRARSSSTATSRVYAGVRRYLDARSRRRASAAGSRRCSAAAATCPSCAAATAPSARSPSAPRSTRRSRARPPTW